MLSQSHFPLGQRLIISRLPSRWCRTVYVYAESCAPGSFVSGPTALEPRIRVTSKKGEPDALRWKSTIHLQKLPPGAKFMVLLGLIDWLFILENVDSRTSTLESGNSMGKGPV